MSYKEINGDLIKLALDRKFDVIAHGCNCFCTMGAGIAPKMAKVFGCDKFGYEDKCFKGFINKLGSIDYRSFVFTENELKIEKYIENSDLTVVNAYTQYSYGKNHKDGVDKPLDYEALTLCLRKINNVFKGKHIGLPGLIGCELAGGKEEVVKEIIKKELKDCDVTIVYLNK